MSQTSTLAKEWVIMTSPNFNVAMVILTPLLEQVLLVLAGSSMIKSPILVFSIPDGGEFIHACSRNPLKVVAPSRLRIVTGECKGSGI